MYNATLFDLNVINDGVMAVVGSFRPCQNIHQFAPSFVVSQSEKITALTKQDNIRESTIFTHFIFIAIIFLTLDIMIIFYISIFIFI